MVDKELQRLRYETSAHHRQILHNHLNSRMRDRLQISANPSKNYQKAYQRIHHEELQKSLALHQEKKGQDQLKKDIDTMIGDVHKDYYRNGTMYNSRVGLSNTESGKGGYHVTLPSLSQNRSFTMEKRGSQLINLNYRAADYKDYDMTKETKALDHTLKNYDGGQGFYKSHDQHLSHQQLQLEKMKETLQNQVEEKQYQRNVENQRRVLEEEAYKQNNHAQSKRNKFLQQIERQKQQNHRNFINRQIQEQKHRRSEKSLFNYNTMTRHNPITNPIEYRIDNPYILRQIQIQNNSYK